MRLPESHPTRDAWWQQQQKWAEEDREFHRLSAGAPDEVWSSWEYEVSQRPKTREEWQAKRRADKEKVFAEMYGRKPIPPIDVSKYADELFNDSKHLAPRYGYHTPHRWHTHVAMPPIDVYKPESTVKVGAGKLFFAPLDTPLEDKGWKPLGYTTEGASLSFDFTADDNLMNNLRAAFGGGTLTTKTDTLASQLREAEDMLNDFTATPDQLEAAAVRMAAQAEAIRAFDKTEPQGDEPTISFRHSYPHSFNTDGSPKEYTFVAVKCDDGKWYLTGRSTRGYSWRELGAEYRAVTEGRFWVATGWDYQGSE